MSETDEVQAAIAGELRLLDPEVRQSRKLAGELLDPEFVEVGSSGGRWNRDEMLAVLPAMPGGTTGNRFEVSEVRGVHLAPGLVHLTFEAVISGRLTLRSSIWRRDAAGSWRMYYHQGTAVSG